MKSISVLVLACLVSAPVLAQNLPDEINFPPYQSRYQDLDQQVSAKTGQLSGAQGDLADSQKFITDMNARLQSLQNHIQTTSAQIAEDQRMIPVLQGQVNDIRNEQAQVNNEWQRQQSLFSMNESRFQQEQQNLRPMEGLLERKRQNVRVLEQDLANTQRMENEVGQRLQAARNAGAQLDSQIDGERRQQAKMKQDLAQIDSNIAALQAQIPSIQNEAAVAQTQIDQENSKIPELTNRIEATKTEISTLTAQGASPQQIQMAQAKLDALNNILQRTQANIARLQSQIAGVTQRVAAVQAQIDQQTRNRTELPVKIAASEDRERQIIVQRNTATQDQARVEAEFYNAHKVTQDKQQIVASARRDLSLNEDAVARQRAVVESFAQAREAARVQMNNLTARSQTLNQAANDRLTEINNRTNEIPRLQQAISTDQTQITQGQGELRKATDDVAQINQSIAQIKQELSNLIAQRDGAHNDMQTRQDLYAQYLKQAQDLGASQSQNAQGLGQKEGDRLANVLGKQNGASVGDALGIAEARLWAGTRGEIQGYDAGYGEGLASAEDISRAQADAADRASKDAEIFAQSNLKPGFFEEQVQLLFKAPLTPAVAPKVSLLSGSMPSLKSLMMSEENFAVSNVSPLTDDEVARATSLKTPLDAFIDTATKDVTSLSRRAQTLSDANGIFSAPTQIPVGSANCSGVYKAVPAFKAACDKSYKEAFSALYVSSVKSTFVAEYPSIFEASFETADVTRRESNYGNELLNATKIGRSEGIRVGKIDTYNRTFSDTYASAYTSELSKATVKAKGDAQRELSDFVNTHPLLTVATTALQGTDFIGGQEVQLQSQVKNVSNVPMSGPVILRITSSENADLSGQNVVINSASAKAVTDLPALKLKISANARGGQVLKIAGVVELPGDLYKASRSETFELRQLISLNPAHALDLNYNKTPSIKGIFHRNVHNLIVTVSPSVEDVADGYTVALSAVTEAGVVDLNETNLATGALKLNQKKDLKFTYTFKNEAKGKTVNLSLKISYKGKIIKEQVLTLQPH